MLSRRMFCLLPLAPAALIGVEDTELREAVIAVHKFLKDKERFRKEIAQSVLDTPLDYQTWAASTLNYSTH